MPSCVLVPAGVPVSMRVASADLVHGFLMQGTNVNAMVVPGYVTPTDQYDKRHDRDTFATQTPATLEPSPRKETR